MEMNFFDVKDVQRWAEMVEQPYDSTDGRHQEIASIAQKLYLQLEHWGNLITQKIDTLVLTGSKMWLTPGTKFRKYLWLQLKSTDHMEIPVFFTIEVNSYDRKESWGNSVADHYNRKEHDGSLVIKMDVQWAGTKDTLPPEKVEEFEKLERRRLPPDMDYSHIQGLRLEAREKLAALRPENLGQAGRISGVSPADIAALMVYLHTRETPPEGGTST